MKLPTGNALMHQAMLAVGGAVLAAVIIGAVPGLRDWIARQWKPSGGCSCRDPAP